MQQLLGYAAVSLRHSPTSNMSRGYDVGYAAVGLISNCIKSTISGPILRAVEVSQGDRIYTE